MSTAKMKNIADLDQLVSEYLIFRKCNEAAKLLNLRREFQASTGSPGKAFISSKILSAFDEGDYATLLNLWEMYIVQPSTEMLSQSLAYETKAAEFLCNLHCAVYPFRSEVIRRVDAPETAAKAAARSMTIFKRFYESRGGGVATQGSEFHNYRALYKIAFPPTHPQCKELFIQGWVPATRSRIEFFLEQFLDAIGADSHNKTMPTLYKLYANSLNGLGGEYNQGGVGDEKLPPEVLVMFKHREENLVRFSRTIIDITTNLLWSIEEGVTLDKDFLSDFKAKFDFFRNALPEIQTSDNGTYKDTPPPPLMIEEGKEGDKVTVTGPSSIGKGGKHSSRHGNLQSANRVKRKKRSREIDIHALNLEEIVSDFFSKVHEVENFLIESIEQHTTASESEIDSIEEPKQSAKTKYAVTSAMSGSALACTLAHMIVRPDKEDQPAALREAAVNILIQCDILGVVKRRRRRASIERMEPDTSNWAQLIITSMRNEGVVGFVDALRSFIPVHSMAAAAKERNRASSSITCPGLSESKDGLSFDSNVRGSNDSNGLMFGTGVIASFHGLLEASECLCESLYRLVVAIGSTDAGREYLHTYGSELTSNTTKLLILLPSSFTCQDTKMSSAVFSDIPFDGSSVSFLDSIISDSVDKKVLPADLHQDADPASSLRLWCILALTILSSHEASGGDTYANEEVMRAVQRVVRVVKKDNLQLVMVEDGALEWLNEAFFSLLMEILAAAFSGNAIVIRAAAGNDSLAIGMAALSLDVRRQSAVNIKPIGDNISSGSRDNSTLGQGGLGGQGGVGGQGPFSISSTTCDNVPRELLVLLDLCLGMLLFTARDPAVQVTLTSTTAFQELGKSLLKTLLRLVLLPQLTQALADSILVVLNVLCQKESKIRELARDLKEMAVLERKISLGGLKWFMDPLPLRKLMSLINDSGMRHDNNLSNRESYDNNGHNRNNGDNGSNNGNYSHRSERNDGSDYTVASLADLALNKVMVTQTYATDNTQLLAYLRKQKSFTGKVNMSLLSHYEDPSKVDHGSPQMSDRGSIDDRHDSANNRLSRDRLDSENDLPNDFVPFTPRKNTSPIKTSISPRKSSMTPRKKSISAPYIPAPVLETPEM